MDYYTSYLYNNNRWQEYEDGNFLFTLHSMHLLYLKI